MLFHPDWDWSQRQKNSFWARIISAGQSHLRWVVLCNLRSWVWKTISILWENYRPKWDLCWPTSIRSILKVQFWRVTYLTKCAKIFHFSILIVPSIYVDVIVVVILAKRVTEMEAPDFWHPLVLAICVGQTKNRLWLQLLLCMLILSNKLLWARRVPNRIHRFVSLGIRFPGHSTKKSGHDWSTRNLCVKYIN